MTESTSHECIFCRIARRDIAAEVVHQDEELVAFEDLNPQAPTHVLLIPRKHLVSVDDLSPEDEGLIGRLVLAAQQVARARGLADSGYRLVLNTGEDAGQSVHHIHLHLLGGRRLLWPPG